MQQVHFERLYSLVLHNYSRSSKKTIFIENCVTLLFYFLTKFLSYPEIIGLNGKHTTAKFSYTYVDDLKSMCRF